jgi:hypothetical protein
MMHSQPSNECPIHKCDLQQFLVPLLVCGKDVEHFVAFSKPIWNACSILNTLILKVGYTINMDIMRQSGIFI